MKVSVLASGSKGNASYLQLENTNILIDVGVSTKYIETKLKELNVDPKTINCIFLTHVHNDHIYGLKTFIKKYNPIIYLSESMYHYLNKLMPIVNYQIINESFSVNTTNVKIIKLSHDSEEVYGYIFKEQDKELVYITDTGYINVRNHYELSNKNFYIIESNHDIELLMKSKYPNHLKRRIISDKGHLSNEASAKYIDKFLGEKTKGLILIHMSEENNAKEKVLETFNNVLKDKKNKLKYLIVSNQKEKTELIEID